MVPAMAHRGWLRMAVKSLAITAKERLDEVSAINNAQLPVRGYQPIPMQLVPSTYFKTVDNALNPRI